MTQRIMTKEMTELLSHGLHDLGLDERIVNQLEHFGVYTVEDLLMKTEVQIRSLPNLGDKAMTSIYSCLEAKGFVRSKPPPAARKRKS